MSKYTSLKEQALEANLQIPHHGLAIFTFGNVSAYDSTLGAVAIKPSGVAYSQLSLDHMVVLDLEGKKIEGNLRPSSDTPTHLALYRHFPDLGGIVHTHSTYATSWSQACRSIPLYGTTHADFSPHGVPMVPFLTAKEIDQDYEGLTGETLVRYFQNQGLDYHHCPFALLAGHGPFCWGKDPSEAIYHAAVLEQIAQMAWLTESIRTQGNQSQENQPDQVHLQPLPDHYINKHFSRKHGPNAYYGQG
jgi:L-ribulose-5-phosphate 4-epimerase